MLSFPIGSYVVFNSGIGKELTYQYPINGLDLFLGGISYKMPFSFEIGDAFIIAWLTFIILFSISFLGPRGTFLKTLSNVITEGWNNVRQENGLINMISWFSILVLSSEIIENIQNGFGVTIESPHIQNNLIQFFQISTSPITEEFGFRVLLVGIPLFLIYSNKSSLKSLFKSLWRPSHYLGITNYKKTMAIIITVGIFFGVAHVISGTPWSIGKISQASIAGIIIGWVYVRYGFAPAALVHWATNYFIFSYLFFISNLSQTTIESVSTNPFSNMLEGIIIIVGVLSIAIKILNNAETKRNLQKILTKKSRV